MSETSKTVRTVTCRVISNKMEGKADKSRGRNVYMEASRMMSANVMLNDIRRSSSIGGRGIIINARIATTATAMVISLFLEIPGSCPATWVCSAIDIIFNCKLTIGESRYAPSF